MLDAKEQAMYLRLLLICNRLRRPDWFSVSNSQLMRELKVKSIHTVVKLRDSLMQKGFIESRRADAGKMTEYRLPILYEDILSNFEVDPLENYASTPAKNTLTSVKNALDPCKICTSTPVKNALLSAKNAQNPCKKCTHLKEKNKDIKDIKSRVERETPTTNINSKLATKDFKETLDVFQKEIHMVASPLEIEKLADDVETYGKEITIRAIKRASIRGKRSIGYIDGILRSWKEIGYDEKESNSDQFTSSTWHVRNRTTRIPRYDPEAERTKFATQTSGWTD